MEQTEEAWRTRARMEEVRIGAAGLQTQKDAGIWQERGEQCDSAVLVFVIRE